MASGRQDAAAQESGQSSGGKDPKSQSKHSPERQSARGHLWKRVRRGRKRRGSTPPREKQDQGGQAGQDCQEQDRASHAIFLGDHEEETTVQIRAARALPPDPEVRGSWWLHLWLVADCGAAIAGINEEWEELDINIHGQGDGPLRTWSKTYLGRFPGLSLLREHARLYWERRPEIMGAEEGIAGLLADGRSLLLVCDGAHDPDVIRPRLVNSALNETQIGDGWRAYRFGQQNYLVRMPSRSAANAAAYTSVPLCEQNFSLMPYVPDDRRCFYLLEKNLFWVSSLVEAIRDALPGHPFYASYGTRRRGRLIVVLIYFARPPGIRKAILPVPRKERRKVHSPTLSETDKRKSSPPSSPEPYDPISPPNRPYLAWLLPIDSERRCLLCSIRHRIGHCQTATAVQSPFTLVDNPMIRSL